MPSHEQKTSFYTYDQVGSGDKLAPPPFLCSAKRGPFLCPSQFHAKHRAQLRSMIAQATAMRREGVIDGREPSASPDWKCDGKAASDLNHTKRG
jgi:hypothetical protein